ncbi:hybrid sensor histidine kinase/response regulator [Oscillatoriales cyanobacterium USR001]|nr:hybrid sensor histidine kinase/response regulator [Oscillatoriales cyanobacterium USR001]
MKKPSILIIDDEPDNFDVIETFLSDRDYLLHYATNGQDAIATLETFNPDLILLDVMMPGIDGIEVCRRIKAMSKWQAIPIIMVTALNSKSDLADCLNAGADDFITKPVNAIELRARVHSMLRIKHHYDDLQTLLKLREDMVNMIVHDLRNPLTGVLLSLDLLRNVEYPREQQQKKLGEIYSSAKVLQVLIDDLLQISLLESGKFRFNYTAIDLCELIPSVLSNFEAIAAQKNLSLISKLPDLPSRKVTVDANMIHRTLNNLLSNAIKFSPPHTQIIVKVEFLTSGDVKIQVIDSGPGVPDPLRLKIFEKYEIGTLMPGISQIGLGLAFCKMVVEAHGGKISVSNNQPQGAIFEIILAT